MSQKELLVPSVSMSAVHSGRPKNSPENEIHPHPPPSQRKQDDARRYDTIRACAATRNARTRSDDKRTESEFHATKSIRDSSSHGDENARHSKLKPDQQADSQESVVQSLHPPASALQPPPSALRPPPSLHLNAVSLSYPSMDTGMFPPQNGSGSVAPMVTKTTPEGTRTDKREFDVLCGKSSAQSRHPGNKLFRDLVAYNKRAYVVADSNETKTKLAEDIVLKIHAHDGRFIEAAPDGGWKVQAHSRSVSKAQQALRDRSKDRDEEFKAQFERISGFAAGVAKETYMRSEGLSQPEIEELFVQMVVERLGMKVTVISEDDEDDTTPAMVESTTPPRPSLNTNRREEIRRMAELQELRERQQANVSKSSSSQFGSEIIGDTVMADNQSVATFSIDSRHTHSNTIGLEMLSIAGETHSGRSNDSNLAGTNDDDVHRRPTSNPHRGDTDRPSQVTHAPDEIGSLNSFARISAVSALSGMSGLSNPTSSVGGRAPLRGPAFMSEVTMNTTDSR